MLSQETVDFIIQIVAVAFVLFMMSLIVIVILLRRIISLLESIRDKPAITRGGDGVPFQVVYEDGLYVAKRLFGASSNVIDKTQ